MKRPHNYNKAFGDGTLLGAISYSPPKQFVGYMSRQWNQIMDGNKLKPKPVLEKITGDNRQHLGLSIQAAAYANDGNPPPPTGLAEFQYFPIAFNTTGHNPGPARWMEFIKLGGSTFYAFKPGREFQ